jgi:DNA-binding XRE family transcriptional regulator
VIVASAAEYRLYDAFMGTGSNRARNLIGYGLFMWCPGTDAVITMARVRTVSARPNAMISAAQCRSARALLGWSVAKLASVASVSASAIDDFEAERRAPMLAVAGPIRRAFEPVGVAFLRGEDVRLRPRALFEVGPGTIFAPR